MGGVAGTAAESAALPSGGGKQWAVRDSKTSENAGDSVGLPAGNAQCNASAVDPGLAAVIARWPGLSGETRQQVLDLIAKGE